MPWHIERVEGRYCVVKDDDGATEGCHDTHDQAMEQLSALYASERQAAAAAPCSCNATRVATVTRTAALADPFPVPQQPPRAWFDRPDWLEPGQRLTITDEGQVAGYFYQHGVCIVDGTHECWEPPPSPTGYAMFHQGEVVTAEGEHLAVGVIGNVGGHASPFVGPSTAQRHYADPNCQLVVCRAGDDEHGGWIAGALVPGVTEADVALVRRSALSGDWRPMNPQWFRLAGVAPLDPHGYDCVGPTLVNRPGLPLLRAFSVRAASVAPVWLGGMGGVQLPDSTGGQTMKVTRPDGTVLDLHPEHDAAVIASLLDETRTAAPMDTMETEGEEAPSSEAGGEALTARVDNHEERIAALEDALANALAYIDSTMEAEIAAMDAAAVPLPEAPAAS